MNTENPNPSNRSALAKIVTVIGLFGIIIFLAWSAIQIVKLFPSALNSLASLADSVYNYKPDTKEEKISVNADRSIMNNGETLTIWWENKNESGTYTFNYSCKDGVAIDVRSPGKDFTSISCDKNFDLGLTDRIEVKIDSEKARFAEVAYTISYFENNNEEVAGTETKTISVINTKFEETPGSNDTSTSTKPTDQTPPKPDNYTPSKPTPAQPVITKPTPTEPTYIYEIPTSNPKGQTDLLVSNLKIGTKSRTEAFVNTDHIIKNQEGAIEFVVHNIGNKTSESWTFTAKLPDGVNYTSPKQSPLKPNERATIIVSFPAINDTDLQKISLLILIPAYILSFIYNTFYSDGYGFISVFFVYAWSVPASIVIFIIGLFIFGFKKVDIAKLAPLQYSNKIEKGVVWFYILILSTLVFVTYLTKTYVPFYEIRNIDTQIKESNTQERQIEEKLKTESELNKNEPKVKEYAMQHAQDNVFLCIKFIEPDKFIVSENYLIEHNYLYQRIYSDQYSVPDNHVAVIKNNKIIFNDKSGIDPNSLRSCYNKFGERIDEKYEIVI